MSFADSYAFLDEWVIQGLQALGIDASYQPLNDITSPLGKIGGAAQKRLGAGAVLHHVTMAYDMNPSVLLEVLRIGREKLSDKGSVSANKRVAPIRQQTDLPRETVIQRLIDTFRERYGLLTDELTTREREAAQALRVEKFETDDWLYLLP
jgi:lipoate-protein ligase A